MGKTRILRVSSIAALGVVILGSIMAAMSATGEDTERKIPMPKLPTVRMRAPDLPGSFKWLNTDRPLGLHDELKGQVVILDFWTYCCINCMHVLPDLHKIETKYAKEPVAVIGVHSAKFENESDPQQIKDAIARYHIGHPVIVDEGHRIWDAYGVRSWPTLVFIDSEGKVVGSVSGEGNGETIDAVVGALLAEGKEKGTLASGPVEVKGMAMGRPMDELYFPGKISADAPNNRLVISDSNHNRLVIVNPGGEVQVTVGSGERGFKDGDLKTAQFNNPQGTAIEGDLIYVADTDNHAIRKVDMKNGQVTTVAGTGSQVYDRSGGQIGTRQGLNSPWDVALDGDRLIIAMAGPHQLWVTHLKSGVTESWVGSGYENITDGIGTAAALAQPSGLAILGDKVYFADSEVSAIRSADLKTGAVQTLIGTGLFNFGFKDGPFKEALLQHPLGVATDGTRLYVADTYNHRLRMMDLKSGVIRTLYGGDEAREQLNEPGGLAVLKGMIYVADTNHHRIVMYALESGKVGVLNVTFSK